MRCIDLLHIRLFILVLSNVGRLLGRQRCNLRTAEDVNPFFRNQIKSGKLRVMIDACIAYLLVAAVAASHRRLSLGTVNQAWVKPLAGRSSCLLQANARESVARMSKMVTGVVVWSRFSLKLLSIMVYELETLLAVELRF